MKLKSYYSPARDAVLKQTVQIRLAADAAPGAPFVLLGDIIHEPVDDNASGMQKSDVSHVIFQHVQEQVYLKYGLQDMGLIKIVFGGGVLPLERVFVDQGKNRLGYNEEATIKVTLSPTGALADAVTFKVSNPALVTITSNTGNGTFKFRGPSKGEFFVQVKVGSAFEQNIPFEISEQEPAVVLPTPVTGVTIAPKTASVAVGATTQLTPTVAPAGATNKAVTYVSATPGVATVSASGLVTGVAAGTSVVTVTTTDGAKTDTATITVTVNVASVTVAPTTPSIAVGATQQLTPTVLPANATVKTVTYVSSAPAVATVNASGLVTAVSVGTTNITVTTTNGAKTAVAAVTVTA